MTKPHLLLLDDYESARATELFDHAARSAPGRPRRMAAFAALLAVIILLVVVGIAYAQEDRSWQATAVPQGESDSFTFTLSYSGGQPTVRIDGSPYDCDLVGTHPRPGSTSTAKVYAISASNGGRCNQLLGGTMEVDARDAQGNQRVLRLRKAEQPLAAPFCELHLRPQPN